MDDDPDTCPPTDAWELPRRPRSRIDDWLLLGAIMLALGILWAADTYDRAVTRLRWRLGGALARLAARLDEAGGRILPDEPPAGTDDARMAEILARAAVAERAHRRWRTDRVQTPTKNGHARVLRDGP